MHTRMLNIQEKISDSKSFEELRSTYGNEFLTKLCDNFNERWESRGQPAACPNSANGGTEENGESASGILGKITAGINAVSETIQDIVNITHQPYM